MLEKKQEEETCIFGSKKKVNHNTKDRRRGENKMQMLQERNIK
jgi:hypothetical protein